MSGSSPPPLLSPPPPPLAVTGSGRFLFGLRCRQAEVALRVFLHLTRMMRRGGIATFCWVIGCAIACCAATVQDGGAPLRIVACESSFLQLRCEGRLHVLRANYGRTSNGLCNEAALNFTEECVSPNANETVALRCEDREECEVEASNTVFGDPCPGTEKYLEVEYECAPSGSSDNPTTLPYPTTMPATEQQPTSTAVSVMTTAAAPAERGPALLYCNTQDVRMLELDSNLETVLASNLNRSVVLDFDFAKDVLVWTDSKTKSIFSAPMRDGDQRRMVLATNVTSYGVAVDWIHANVYWTDTGNDVISVAPMSGGGRKRNLFTDMLDEPRGIVLQPAEGYMYWSDWGEVPKIEKSGMDGTGRKVIVEDGLKWPNGLAIDFESRRLFWIEAFHENLCSSGLEGEDIRRVLAGSPFLKLPFSVDIYGDFVYWTEWTSNKENVFRANKLTGANLTKVLDGETTLMGIKIYHPDKQALTPSVCGPNNGGCTFLCLPSPRGNYSCACPIGMKLQPDGRNCTKAEESNASLLYCNRYNIRRYELGSQEDSLLVEGLQRATVLDYHLADKILIWTDTDNKKIYRGSLEPESQFSTLAGNATSYGVAVDWIHGHVYWTDTLNNVVDVAKLDGSMRKSLIRTELDEPRAIVLNPLEGFMFWSDWGQVPKIERSNMDGTHRRVIVSHDIRWPNGLAIDLEVRRVFWVDGKLNYLSTCDFEGANRRNLITSSSVMRHPFSLDVFGEYLYWVEWSSGKESVYRAPKRDGRGASKVFDGERSLMGLKVMHDSKQPNGTSACGLDNGGCSHLCLPAAGANDTRTYTCACPDTLHMTDDNFNCTATTSAYNPIVHVPIENATENDRPVLLCANVDDIRVIDLETYADYQLIGDLTRAVAVDYLHRNRTVVWTDIREDSIYSAPIREGTVATELVSDTLHPDGLAVDWIHLHMYWTDKGKDAVGVANLDGTMEKTLFANDLDEPRAIAIDPFEGYMFWTDWGRVPKIERAGMDGSGRRVLVSSDIQWPNGITVDLDARQIYWADAKTHKICRSNYNGLARETVLSSYTLLKQPFSIDVFQDTVFWVEWRSGEESVYKANKTTGRNAEKIADGRKWKNLMTIKVFHSSKQPPGPNRCGSDNGGCSHLCLPSPRDSGKQCACACPNSLALAFNGKVCLKEAPLPSSTTVMPTEPDFDPGSTGERPFLLYANKRDVRKMDMVSKTDSLVADGFVRASGIDFHYVKQTVFFTDFEAGKIYSAPVSSVLVGPVRELVSANCTSNGLAVDWVHELLFWTDNKRRAVEVARLDGLMRRTLFQGDDVDEPRTIVLHPPTGWLFWADWGSVPKIVRAGMDGSNRSTIVETGVDWTHALAIDYVERRLLWADGDQKKIFSCRFDGGFRTTVLHAPELLHLPFSMDLYQNRVYWTEFMPLAENIFHVPKLGGGNPTKLVTRRWPNLMSIKIYHSSKQPPYESRCGPNNGGCSHLCLPRPQLVTFRTYPKFTCACPNEMELARDSRGTCQPKGSSTSTTTPSYMAYTILGYNYSTDVSVRTLEDNQSGYHSAEAKAPVGIIVGAIVAVVLLALVGLLVYHRHFLQRNLGNIIFKNPVYRKHKEDDFAIEPDAHHAKSSVPLTTAEL
ncbi:hypothetical protein JTE90_003732 [Oedothorax gibbosus]|uniref:SUEL-type lectin domain-containing protein n=1 Tax=Oedothorax gibbosus TaxID=931172 RepID=A0AAV6VAZ1_9ARAC|nr:hypothetical protein JTE90_003732 [Oedothorax gibbosus]